MAIKKERQDGETFPEAGCQAVGAVPDPEDIGLEAGPREADVAGGLGGAWPGGTHLGAS